VSIKEGITNKYSQNQTTLCTCHCKHTICITAAQTKVSIFSPLAIVSRSSVSGCYSQSNMSSISETRTDVSEDGEKRKTKVSKVGQFNLYCSVKEKTVWCSK